MGCRQSTPIVESVVEGIVVFDEELKCNDEESIIEGIVVFDEELKCNNEESIIEDIVVKMDEDKNPMKYENVERRVIRSKTEDDLQKGRMRRSLSLSDTYFTFPEYWVNPVEDWPSDLFYLSLKRIDLSITKVESSNMISCIHEEYFLEEDLMNLAKFINDEKKKNNHEFIIRTESVRI